MKRLATVMLLALTTARATTLEGPPPDPLKGAFTLRDVFVWTCQAHYAQAHQIPRFDSSYEVAAMTVPAYASQLRTISASAKQVALSLPAPDYSDQEHGVPAVLAHCLIESRRPEVEALLSEPTE